MSDKKKTNTGFIIAIVALAIIVIVLGVTLLIKTSPLKGVIKNYESTYPDSLFSIQKVTGENAQTGKQQINTFCPEFDLEEYYLAQIDDPATQKSLLYVINTATGRTECVIDRSAPVDTGRAGLNQNLLATINGEPVSVDEVMVIYNNIPKNQRTNTSLQESLDTVINNKLLLQDALNKGFTVEEQEVDNAINTFLANNGLSLQQLEQNLMNAGSSINDFMNNIKNNLLLQVAINEITKGVGEPTEIELKTYYEQNKQNLATIPRAVTRQLLLYADETNKDEKEVMIKGIASMLNATNFCDLVTKYSEDTASVERCGLYDFQQGQLLPEYEQVVFSSKPGTVKIIQTKIGFHIVQIQSITPSTQPSFEEAKQGISNYLVLINKQAVLNQFIAQLRQQAEIVSYVG